VRKRETHDQAFRVRRARQRRESQRRIFFRPFLRVNVRRRKQLLRRRWLRLPLIDPPCRLTRNCQTAASPGADFDYSSAAIYVVTICAKDKRALFDRIDRSQMLPNRFGKIVQETWYELPEIIRV
jgi:hypothetical protein